MASKGVVIGCRVGMAVTAAGLVAAVGGCSNPLAPTRAERAPRVPIERFREVAPITLQPAPAKPSESTPRAGALENREHAELTLEQCRAAALTHNLDLKVALINPTIANESLTEAEAAFEATLGVSASANRTDSPTSSSLQDSQAEFQSLEPSVTIPLRTGGSATVSLPMTRSETNNSFSTLNPSYTSDLRFSLSHPLLRGAGRFSATSGILLASYDDQIAQARAKLAVIGVLAEVDRAYWRLYQLRRDLEVRQRQYEVADAQLARAQRRVNAGSAAEIEVVRAQSGVASSLDAIIRAENAVLAQQRELKRIANMPGLDVQTTTVVLPATPPDPVELLLEPDALIAQALGERMEMLELELQMAQDSIGVRLAQNNALPDLDLTASYTVNGLGESLGDSFETTAENRFEDWALGVRASAPLGNEAARSRLRRSILTRLQRISSVTQREQTIRQEVLDAVDEIRAGWQRIIAARQTVILNGRTLDAEQRQFDLGLSTSTDVLDASARLADAQSAEIAAVVDYQIAQINLARATGLTMGSARVRWSPAPAPALEGGRWSPRAAQD